MRKNNKGISLITVIVVVSLVAIMASVVLYSASLNYRMKATNVQTKETFYSAETAMDEVKAGLMQLESNALKEAYVTVLEAYGSKTPAERKKEFSEKYKEVLAAALKDPANPSQYKVDILKSYLVETQLTTDESGNPVSGADITYKGAPELYVNDDKTILKNLVVTYYGEAGSVSIIETDIALNYPQAEFEESAILPGLSEFALIAGKGIEITGGITNINGGVYAGENGLSVTTGTQLTVDSAELFITPGNISVKDAGKLLLKDSISVWAKNILVDNASLEIDGNTYVANDLKLEKNAAVKLSGTYYGYGNPESAKHAASVDASKVDENPSEYSSAILINGVKSSLDMLGIERLMLAGNAYVATKEQDITNNHRNIVMGESLGVKSNQLIYLIPAGSIGIGNDGTMLESGGCNPMPLERYEALKSEIKYDLLQAYGSESQVISGMGVSDMETAIEKAMVNHYLEISELGGNLASAGVKEYTTAFYPNGSSATVYLYMVFEDMESENAYFRNYCSQNSEKVRRYMNVYAESIQINEAMESVVLNGNIAYSKDTGLGLLRDNFRMESAENQDYIKYVQEEYQNTFAALTSALNENYDALTINQRSKEPFENLVNESAITTGGTSIAAGNKKTFTGTRTGNGCIVVNNEGDTAFVVDDSIGITEGIIIATGDVVLQKSFRGLILAKGKISSIANATISADGSAALDALLAGDTAAGIAVMDYLNYVGGSVNVGTVGDTASKETIDLSELITYENWKKK